MRRRRRRRNLVGCSIWGYRRRRGVLRRMLHKVGRAGLLGRMVLMEWNGG